MSDSMWTAWDVVEGTPCYTVAGHAQWITAIAASMSPEPLLFTADAGGWLRMYAVDLEHVRQEARARRDLAFHF